MKHPIVGPILGRFYFYVQTLQTMSQRCCMSNIRVQFVYNEFQGTRKTICYSHFLLQAFCGVFFVYFFSPVCSFINKLSPLSKHIAVLFDNIEIIFEFVQ